MRPDHGQTKQESSKPGIPFEPIHSPPMLIHHQLVDDSIVRAFGCRGDAGLAERQRTAVAPGFPKGKGTIPPIMGDESINASIDAGGEERRETSQQRHGRPHIVGALPTTIFDGFDLPHRIYVVG
jgi:hypothetical protein